MAKLFADVYDESGNLTNLVYGKQITDPERAHAEVLELYRHSEQYRPNDYIYFTEPKINVDHHHIRVNLGPDRYIIFWLQ